MIVAGCTLSGAPGCSTGLFAFAAAAGADGEQSLFVEADPKGGWLVAAHAGVVGAAHPVLARQPGLVEVAQARDTDVQAACQTLGELRVLVGPPEPWLMDRCLRQARSRWVEALASWPGPVFVDCGRLFPDSAALQVVARADVTVVFAEPSSEPLLRSLEWLGEQASLSVGWSARLLVVSGPGRMRVRSVRAQVAAPVFWCGLPWDARAAERLLSGFRLGDRAVARLPLARAARQGWRDLAQRWEASRTPTLPPVHSEVGRV